MNGERIFEWLFGAVIVWIVVVSMIAATYDLVVGERAPSPSPVVTATASSEAAPARSLADGNGEDVVPVEEAEVVPRERVQTVQPEPASTVTQSALKEEGGAGIPRDPFPVNMPSRPTVTVSPTDGGAYIAPATPVATSRAVETIAPKSINSYDPWPAYLWPVVECLIQRESKGNPYAVGLAGERGLMQVHPVTWGYLARYGITPDALFDGPTNLQAGWLLYLWNEKYVGDGLAPWGGGCA